MHADSLTNQVHQTLFSIDNDSNDANGWLYLLIITNLTSFPAFILFKTFRKNFWNFSDKLTKKNLAKFITNFISPENGLLYLQSIPESKEDFTPQMHVIIAAQSTSAVVNISAKPLPPSPSLASKRPPMKKLKLPTAQQIAASVSDK